MDATVSVIVPIYNVEGYLPRCLDSLLSQTYGDFELILVDDGSTDTTGAICDRYGVADARVRVLHQPNAGVSAARNRALDVARGQFLTFVDADDTVDPTYLERLYTGLRDTGADIAAVNWMDSNGKTAYNAALAGADGARLYTQDELADLNLLGSCCGRMFRRSSMSSLSFDEDIFYGEDTLFCVRNFYGRPGTRLLLFGTCLYRYLLHRPGAATAQAFHVRRLTQMEAYRRIRETVAAYPPMLESVDAVRAFAFWHLYLLLLRSGREREFPAEFRQLRRILRAGRRYRLCGQGLRQRAVYRLYLTCGRLAVRLDGSRNSR